MSPSVILRLVGRGFYTPSLRNNPKNMRLPHIRNPKTTKYPHAVAEAYSDVFLSRSNTFFNK